MFVTIQGLPEAGHTHRFRAGRAWGGEAVKVEVLDQNEDPPKVKTKGTKRDTNEQYEFETPDPLRIGRKSFEMLKADNRIRILADGETSGVLSQAALDAARTTAQRLAGELTDAKVRIAELEALVGKVQAERDAAAGERDEAQLKVMELEEKLAKASAPKAERKGGKGPQA